MYTKIDEYGDKFWYLDPELNIPHREGGPAAEHYNVYKCWYINGKLHRVDGPAIEKLNGYKEYYFNDKLYLQIEMDEEWVKLVRLMNFS